jgi:drug/metabolite transporter (DMT)-like permease
VFGGGAANGGFGIDLSALQQPAVVAGILWTGLISTALTNPLEMRALDKLPATDSTMIVSTEPLWAAGFASLFLGEHLESTALIGGGMILLGCISNTLLPADLGTGTEDMFAPRPVRTVQTLRTAKARKQSVSGDH